MNVVNFNEEEPFRRIINTQKHQTRVIRLLFLRANYYEKLTFRYNFNKKTKVRLLCSSFKIKDVNFKPFERAHFPFEGK